MIKIWSSELFHVCMEASGIQVPVSEDNYSYFRNIKPACMEKICKEWNLEGK